VRLNCLEGEKVEEERGGKGEEKKNEGGAQDGSIAPLNRDHCCSKGGGEGGKGDRGNKRRRGKYITALEIGLQFASLSRRLSQKIERTGEKKGGRGGGRGGKKVRVGSRPLSISRLYRLRNGKGGRKEMEKEE